MRKTRIGQIDGMMEKMGHATDENMEEQVRYLTFYTNALIRKTNELVQHVNDLTEENRELKSQLAMSQKKEG